jgi:DNA polymerase-3 subunit delta
MQIRAEQLEAQLSKSLASVYVIHGDEPLLALEAADAIRAAARKQGCDEREVLSVERGFDWSELTQAGASQSLFGGRKIIELRIPSGKTGTPGSAAITAATSFWRSTMASNEISCGPSVYPVIWPVSWVGMKPMGTSR